SLGSDPRKCRCQPFPVSPSRRPLPLTPWRRDALFIEPIGNPAWTLASRIPDKDALYLARLVLVDCPHARSAPSDRNVPVALAADALAIQREPLQRTVSPMRDLTQFLLRHGSLDGDQYIHAGNAGVDPIVRHNVHAQVFELLFDGVHLGLVSAQPR